MRRYSSPLIWDTSLWEHDPQGHPNGGGEYVSDMPR